MVSEEEIKALVDKQWLDRQSNIDEIMSMVAITQIKTNEKINILIDTLSKGLDVDPTINPTIDYTKTLKGLTGYALTGAEIDEMIQVMVGSRTITGFAREHIIKHEEVMIIGGSDTEPDIVPIARLMRGVLDDSLSLTNTDNEGRIISNATQVQNFTVPLDNPNFALGTLDGWNSSGGGTVEIDTTVFHTSGNSAKMTIYENQTLDFYNETYVSIAPEKTITASGYFKADSGLETAYILVRYFNNNKELLTTNVIFDPLNKPITDEAISTTVFVSRLRKTVAPPDAAFAQVGVRAIANNSNATLWVDDAVVPTYPISDRQFYHNLDLFKTSYILPGQSITLHESDYSELGDVILSYFDVNSLDILLTYNVDGISLPVELRKFTHHGSSMGKGIWLYHIDESDADPTKWHYRFMMTTDAGLSYNYRTSITADNPIVTSNEIQHESIGTGDSATKVFSGNLANTLLLYDVDNSMGYLTFTDGIEVFTDNGEGLLTGTAGGTGTINYTTGAYSVTFNSAPIFGFDIMTSYTYLTYNTTPAIIWGGHIWKKVYI